MAGSTYFKKLTIIILATSMLPVIVFGIYSAVQNNTALKNQVHEKNITELTKTRSNVEETLNFIQDYYTLIMLYQDLSGWSEAEINYRNVSEISALQKLFAGGMITYDLIKEVILVNEKQDWTISQSRVGTLRSNVDYEDIVRLIRADRNIYWQFVPRDVTDTTRLLIGNICLVIKSGQNGTGASRQLMIITISNYQFTKLMTNNSDAYPTMVLDGNGLVIYDADKDNVGKNYQELDGLSEFDFSMAESGGSFSGKAAGKHFNYMKSEFNDFIYVSYYTDVDISSASTTIVDFAFVLGSILTLVILILTYFESRFMYRPIKNVVQGFGEANDAAGRDEFEIINRNIGDLLKKNSTMRLEMAQYEPMLQELFLMKLVRGQSSPDNTEEMAKQLGIFDRWVYMSIFVIQIDTDYESMLGHDILLLEVCSLVSNVIPQDRRLKNSISNGKGIFLLGSTKEMLEDFMEELYHYGKKIAQEIKEALNINITIGVSTVFDDLNYANKAYRESVNVLIYRGFLDGSSDAPQENIVFFDDLKPDAGDKSEYPKELVVELTRAISNLDKAAVSDRLNEVIMEIFNHRSLLNEFQFYTIRLTADILLILDIGHNYTKLFNMQSTILEELSKIVTPEDMKKYFITMLIEPIMETINENGNSQDLIVDKVLQMIHKEYMTDLSIEQCAERLNYHPTYIWRVMKNKLNTTFQDYLINYRMEIAKSWLLETDMTVGEIAAKLKYNNAQNFIRSFKKIEGTTPGKYRETQRNQ